MSVDGWLSGLFATTAPALPDVWLVRLYLPLGWAVVLAALVGVLPLRIGQRARRVACLLVALWALVPGPVSPAYWLGLAFQAPGLTSVLLGAWLLAGKLKVVDRGAVGPEVKSAGVWQLALPMLLGYALLLDTLALLPVQMYSWGFCSVLLLVLLIGALLPWLLLRQIGIPAWVIPVALLVFTFTRLPTGNVWDALMDPLLWLLVQGFLIRMAYRKLRPSGPV